MIEETLARLGFSPSEIKIYLHMVRSGSSYANRLSIDVGLNRTNVYEAMDRLIAKGVVSFIVKNKVKWYEAKPPESIVSIIRAKEEELEIIKKSLSNDVDSLKSNPTKNNLEASIFVGKKGLRMLFEEILDTGKPISLIASKLQFRDFFGPYFELWHKMRIKKGIKQRSIFPKDYKSKLKNRKLLQYKFVDNEFTNPTTTIMYGEKCLFIQWSKEPIGIRIQNKEVATSHLNYFNMLWSSNP